MARIDSFLKKWASVPSQFERPTDALIDRGWAGGAAEDPPEAKWENWWHNRVDEALAELESKGALQWFADVSYLAGATACDEGENWIAALPSAGIKPGSAEDLGHWAPIGAKASETLRGLVRIGTQPEVDAGSLDDVSVTPKKLRWGFAWSFAANGYIIFPSWLKGWVVQWVAGSHITQGQVINWPIAFPNQCLGAFPVDDASSSSTVTCIGLGGFTPNSVSMYSRRVSDGADAVAGSFRIYAFGN